MVAYDGASKAWEGFKAGRTASSLLSGGLETLISGTSAPVQKPGGLAMTAIFTAILGVIIVPPFLKKG